MSTKKPAVVPIREQIYDWIQDAILTNEFKSGDVIQIDRLARDFGVSATPIRETLIRLENSGLVTLIPNKGAVVTEFSIQDIYDTWEMRKVLEPYAARLSAKLHIQDEIAVLEKKVMNILNDQRDFHYYMNTDHQMHELLFIHIKNNLLKETLQRIHHLSRRMRYSAESISSEHRQVMEQVCREHLDILNALKTGDPDKAEQSVLTHIEHSEKRTLSSMEMRTKATL
jgi:DNA-binding GntR family transcriptional regulator